MNDGNCPGYSEAMDYASAGLLSTFIVVPEGLSFTAYDPTINELQVFLYPDQLVRGAGHAAFAVKLSKEISRR